MCRLFNVPFVLLQLLGTESRALPTLPWFVQPCVKEVLPDHFLSAGLIIDAGTCVSDCGDTIPSIRVNPSDFFCTPCDSSCASCADGPAKCTACKGLLFNRVSSDCHPHQVTSFYGRHRATTIVLRGLFTRIRMTTSVRLATNLFAIRSSSVLS
jgi:hypothetical protein